MSIFLQLMVICLVFHVYIVLHLIKYNNFIPTDKMKSDVTLARVNFDLDESHYMILL